MDKKKPVEKDAADSLLVKKMGETVESSPSQFRTVEHVDAATGDKTRLRTKGGNPQVVVERTPPKKQESGCPKPPFVEVGFKYAAEPGTDPNRNPYTVTSGYRTWHGEPNPALPISPTNPKKVKRFNFSHDGLFCIEARKPKRLSFKDANNKKVELLLAEKPNDPDDTANTENQEYATSGDGTFVNVAKARATAQGTDAADFKYSEGRYKYREWYPPEWQDIGWALKFVPNAAFKFMTKRLRKISVLLTKKGSEAVKSIEWIFCNKDTQAYTGTPAAPLCAENNLREKSFSGRSFYSPNGHLSEVVMRARYAGLNPPYSGGDEVKFSLKRPGSILMNIDPEWVIPETGSTTHPGADDCIDIQDFAAFGNAYHGLVWWNGSSYTFYKDSTRAETIPVTPANLSPITQRYYNFSGVSNTTADEHVIRRKLPDNTYSYEAFYKDAIMYFGSTLVTSTGANYGRLTQDEILYKDPAGTVWVIEIFVTSIYDGPENSILPCAATLLRKYGDIATNFDWNNHGIGFGQTNLGTLGGVPSIDFWPFFNNNKYGRGWAVPWYKDPDYIDVYRVWADAHAVPSFDGKKCLAINRTGDWMAGIANGGGRIIRATLFTFSGTGAIEADAENGIVEGQGITCVAEDYPIKDPWPIPSPTTVKTQYYYYTCGIPNPAYPSSEPACLSQITGSGTITCGPEWWQKLDWQDWIVPRTENLGEADPYTVQMHNDYDFFWRDGRFVPISVRYTTQYVSASGSKVGSYVEQSYTSNPYCDGPTPKLNGVSTAFEQAAFQYTSFTWEYRIELIVDGVIVHAIGIQCAMSTSRGYLGLPQLLHPSVFAAGFTGVQKPDAVWDTVTVTTLDGASVPISIDPNGNHRLDLVPMAKLIPKVAGATKAAKGTKERGEWQRATMIGTQFEDYALTLVYEGRTTAHETAISTLPTKLVFRDAVLETTMASFLPVPIDATNELYSPNGWAYNPRTKELILVPNGEIGYFF